MKRPLKLLALASVLCAAVLTLQAADKKHLGGPKGGRLLEKTDPKAEFFLETNHTVTITFYDAAVKPIPASTQTVTVIANAKDGKQIVEFVNNGGVLVSKTKLPEGDGYNVVVQLKQTADARPQNFRFNLDAHACNKCKRAEYACICDE